MTLGKRIRCLRQEANLTGEELAKLVGVNTNTIYQWENGVNRPRMYYMASLAKALNTTSDYLLWGKEFSVEKLIKDKVIDKVIIAPRLDRTGYYLQFFFVDGSELRITDKILYKNKDTEFKEIFVL